MKKCPECGREYDLSMSFCLDDGAELLYGPAMSGSGAAAAGFLSSDEPMTAILHETAPPAEAARVRVEIMEESRQRYIAGYIVAMVHAALGERDAAFELLEKDLTERSSYLPSIRADPVMDDLRADPRLAALMKKIESSKLE